MAAITTTPSRRHTYRGYRRHPKSIIFCFVVIAVTLKLTIFLIANISLLISPPPKDLSPAKPVERRETPVLYSNEEALPSWTTAWIHDRGLDSEMMKGLKQGVVLDLVYTWVNGSDTGLQMMKDYYKQRSPMFQAFEELPQVAGRPGQSSGNAKAQTEKRFRDMDELRHSIRSVAEYATPGLFNKIHILTTDVEQEDQGTGEKRWQQQVPEWLDHERAKGKIELVRHREIYDDPGVLPSFNSLSIESQMHHIPGLAKIFVYLNDDIFFGNPINIADLWTPLYGFVFHMDTLTAVDPVPPSGVDNPSTVGEWQSLHYTNWILSKQFGARHRVYLAHIPHILSVPIMNEIQALWPDEFVKTSSHRFRGEGQAREIQVSFLLAHYVMERLRETQLKSYWKYRLDRNQDSTLDWEERQQLIQIVEDYNAANGVDQRANPSSGNKDGRGFLEGYEDHLRDAGILTNVTKYARSGMDEYPFMLAHGDLSKSSSLQAKKPYFLAQHERTCTFDIEFCLGTVFRNQSIRSLDTSTGPGSIFERLAFTEFHCGDCLLHILHHASAVAGTSAIMPLDRTSKAFRDVTADLFKYNYVVGQSDFVFLQLKNGMQAEAALNKLMRWKDVQTFFCINDDVQDNAQIIKRVRNVFSKFLSQRFPKSSPWEKPGSQA
ncbi:Xanthine phosphoribosyltransferase 1 [Mortierella sp. GBA30]|nr:Xanthine phosphoribosyltransferase 1 [Mortierella sp. GBA30]